MRSYAIGCGVALVVLSVAYVFIFGVRQSNALEMLTCMRVCAPDEIPCLPGTCALKPTVITIAPTLITAIGALGHGYVTSDGFGTISQRGIALGTTTDPTIDDTKFVDTATGTGAFSVSLTDLTAASDYVVRAYAINEVGVGYGTSTSFTTLAVSTPTSTEPSTTVPIGGGMPIAAPQPVPPPFEVFPEDLSAYLIVDHPVQGEPYVAITAIRDIKTGIRVPVIDASTLEIDFSTFAIEGVTNIRDAWVFINIYSEPMVFSVRADSEGLWSLAAVESIPPGVHRVAVQAVSPYSSTVQAFDSRSLVLKEQGSAPYAPPSQVVEPSSPSPELNDGYAIDVDIQSEPESISREGNIDVVTELLPPPQAGPEYATLTYTVYDIFGMRYFSESKEIFLTGQSTDVSRIVLSQRLKPGTYIVEAQIEAEGMKYVSTKEFEVRSHPILSTPVVTLTYDDTRRAMQGGIGVLSLTMAALLIFMYREFQAAKRIARQLNDADLLQGGLIE
jgi:hypothetical protein